MKKSYMTIFSHGEFVLEGTNSQAEKGAWLLIMKKLLAQIIKFGFVGGLCFLIDFAISFVLVKLLANQTGNSAAAVIGGFFGFTISVIVNYVLSMKYVFVRKEELDRRKEFVIFIVLSVIGLGINELILWGCARIYEANPAIAGFINFDGWFAASKVIATAIVMVYNFISRKIFLEQKGEEGSRRA